MYPDRKNVCELSWHGHLHQTKEKGARVDENDSCA